MESEPENGAPGADGDGTWVRRLGVAAVVIAFAAVAVTPLLAARDQWLPLGERAIVAIRAHDVTSGDLPLVGMPSTIDTSEDAPGDRARRESARVHHPGPLLFWLLALPDRLTGSRPLGISAGTAAINLAAMAFALWAVARRGGRAATLGLLPLLLALCWSLDRLALIDPLNASASVLPFAAFGFVAWAVSCGDRAMLPVAAFLASFAVQAHVIYIIPVAALTGWALLGCLLARRAMAETSPGPSPRVAYTLTAGIVAFSWAAPLWEQFTNSPGNLGLVGDPGNLSAGRLTPLDHAIRLLTNLTGAPPLFSRGPMSFPRFNESSLADPRWYVATTAVLVVALLVFAATRHRPRDPEGARLAVTALVGLAAVAVTLTRLPVSWGWTPRYQALMLLPVSMPVWFACGRIVALHYRCRFAAYRQLDVAGATSVLVAVTALGTALDFGPLNERSSGTAADWRATRALVTGTLPDLDPDATYVLRSGGTRAFWSIRFGILRELLRRGFDLRVEGNDRVYFDGAHSGQGDSNYALVVVSGGGPVAGGRLAAHVDQGAAQRAKALVLGAEANAAARANVTAAGRAAAESPDDALDEAMASVVAGEPASAFALAVLTQAKLTHVPGPLLEDVAALESEARRLEPLAVWVVPVG